MRRSRPRPGRGGLALAGGRRGGAGRRELTYAAGGRGGAAACGAGPETLGPDPLPTRRRTGRRGEAAPPCPGRGRGRPGGLGRRLRHYPRAPEPVKRPCPHPHREAGHPKEALYRPRVRSPQKAHPVPGVRFSQVGSYCPRIQSPRGETRLRELIILRKPFLVPEVPSPGGGLILSPDPVTPRRLLTPRPD